MDSLSNKDGEISVTRTTGKTLGAAAVVFCLLTEWGNSCKHRKVSFLYCTQSQGLVLETASVQLHPGNKTPPQTFTLRTDLALMY